MIRRLASLYQRYEMAHLTLHQRGRPIVDERGARIGYVDVIRYQAGRLRVQGWAQARKLCLSMAGAEAQMAPVLRRPDVANAMNFPETIGFDLSIPASLEDITSGEKPCLLITPETHDPDQKPLSQKLCVKLRGRWRTTTRFLWDGTRAFPAALGWLATSDPAYRAQVKARMRLGPRLQSGPLEPCLFREPSAIEPDVTEQRVSLVLPVYNAHDLLEECLDRVARHTDLPWRLVLINDGSSDPRIAPLLQSWVAAHPHAELITHTKNLGFVAAVNSGLAHVMDKAEADDGPVILLNSDALVPSDWASRLVRPFYQQEEVASVTPMSNDAEIFSVPVICARQSLLPGQLEAMDAAALQFAPEALLSVVPTGVGFCMAIGRDWLAKLPQFDTAFGRGYGEEVDWCQKIIRMGGRHLGLPGLFVEHRGSESFGSADKAALVASHNRIISSRYPDYDPEVQEFISADPMRTARLALGMAWAGSLSPDHPVPVYLAHSLGGGADYWLEHRLKGDVEARGAAVVIRVGGAYRWQLELVTEAGRSTGQSDEIAIVERLVALLPKRHVVYSCGVGDRDPVQLPGVLRRILQKGDTAEILFHDFFPLSPSYTLLDGDGIYRGPVVPSRQDPVHQLRRPDGTLVSLREWQGAWRDFASRAKLTVFSQDSSAQVSAVWPDLAAQISHNPHQLRDAVPTVTAQAKDAPEVIGVLGNIGAHKGADVVQGLSRKLAQNRCGPKLVLIGNIDPNYALPASVAVHGTYRVKDLQHLLNRYGITRWLIPSVWPETFCYTVHEALQTGLPAMGFDIGAQGEALRAANNGIPLPFDPEANLVQTVLEALDRGAETHSKTERR